MTYTKIDVIVRLAEAFGMKALNWTFAVGCLEWNPENKDLVCLVRKLGACWAQSISGSRFGEITFFPGQLDEPLKRRKPGLILCAWRSEIAEIPQRVLFEVMDVIKQCPRHAFLKLTKKPALLGSKLESLRGTLGYPQNLFIGTSMNVQSELYRARDLEKYLAGLGAYFWFVEPCLGRWEYEAVKQVLKECPHTRWVVVGGWSDLTPDGIANRNPIHAESVKAIVHACRDSHVPVALKDNIDIRLRQQLGSEFNATTYPPLPACLGGQPASVPLPAEPQAQMRLF